MKILKLFIVQLLIGIITIKMKNSIDFKFAIFMFIMLEIWAAYLLYQINKGEKKKGAISRNGSYGAKMFCIVTSAILLVYVLELFRYKSILAMVMIATSVTLFIMRKEIMTLLMDKRFRIKTVALVYSIILFLDGLYAIITIIFPQIHYLHGYALNGKQKIIIIFCCIIIATLSLPSDAIIAQFATQNYKNNILFNDDENNET